MEDFKLRRSRLMFYVMRHVADVVHGNKYEITHEGTENIPRKGPVLIAAKHQNWDDIVGEGRVLHQHTKRQGNWVMRTGLYSGWRHWRSIKLGGIEMVRPTREDIERARQATKSLINRTERKAAIHAYLEETVKEANKKPTEYVKWLLQKGELVVLHPEGTRNPGEVKYPVMGLINYLKEFETKHNLNIQLVIMGIHYTPTEGRTKVHFNIGKPRSLQEDNLANTIYAEMQRLSNLPRSQII